MHAPQLVAFGDLDGNVRYHPGSFKEIHREKRC